jgi:hypothetical protein
MTNEEAIKLLDDITSYCDFTDEYGDMIDSDPYYEALDMAIKALEQEPILDKIRDELIENSIEDYEYHGCGTDELIIETSQVLKIIDKYKVEGE